MIGQSSRFAILVAAIIFCAPASPTVAQEAEDCAAATSTPEQNACLERALSAADARLDEAYQRALDHIAGADQITEAQRNDWEGALREAQRRWMRFRDLDCGEVIGFEWLGGTGMTAAMLGCKLAKTEARTTELEERYPAS